MVADKCVPLSKSVHYLFMVNMHLCMYHIYYCSQQLVSLYDVVTDYQLSKKQIQTSVFYSKTCEPTACTDNILRGNFKEFPQAFTAVMSAA